MAVVMKTILLITAAALVGFALGCVLVYVASPPKIIFTWETASEVDTAGFIIHRSDSADGPFFPITGTPVLAQGDPLVGDQYEYVDTNVIWGRRYFYKLEEVERSGAHNMYPKVAEGIAGVGWPWALGAGALLAIVGGVEVWYLDPFHSRPAAVKQDVEPRDPPVPSSVINDRDRLDV
jgi:hypothetical protein